MCSYLLHSFLLLVYQCQLPCFKPYTSSFQLLYSSWTEAPPAPSHSPHSSSHSRPSCPRRRNAGPAAGPGMQRTQSKPRGRRDPGPRPRPRPRPRLLRSHRTGLGAARDRVNPLTGLEACPGKLCPSDSAVPPPGGRGLGSPKYSPLGGWFMSCTSFLVSLSSSSSGGWLGGTWEVRIRGLALPLAPSAVTKGPQGDQAVLPRKLIREQVPVHGLGEPLWQPGYRSRPLLLVLNCPTSTGNPEPQHPRPLTLTTPHAPHQVSIHLSLMDPKSQHPGLTWDPYPPPLPPAGPETPAASSLAPGPGSRWLL